MIDYSGFYICINYVKNIETKEIVCRPGKIREWPIKEYGPNPEYWRPLVLGTRKLKALEYDTGTKKD